MAFVVKLYANDKLIQTRWCRRTKPLKDKNAFYPYETDDGRTIYHVYSNGANTLARMLLEEEIPQPPKQNGEL